MKKNWTAKTMLFMLAIFLVVPGMANAANDSASFKDVGTTFWAKEEIDSLVKLGIISGFEDNTFKPQASVTREQFAKLITSSFYLDIPGDNTQTFVDVSTTRWSYSSIEASKEFLTGYYPPSGKAFFNPTGKATREDVAVALVKTLGYQPDELEDPDILDRYYDSDEVSPNIETYVALAVEKKLLNGYQDRTLRPNSGVTRAEVASLLFRVIKNSSGDSQSKLALNVAAPETTSSPTFYISGDVTKGAKVYINNKEVEVVQGEFRLGVRLEEEGVYTYTITARLSGGKTETVTKKVKFEKGAPTLEVKGVPETTDKETITVSWVVKDDNDSSPVVYVNDERQYYTSSVTIQLVEGDNAIKVRAENASGKSTEVIKHVIFNSDGPVLTVGEVPGTTSKETVTVSWTVKDKNDPSPKVFVNDEQMYYTSTTSIQLKEGSNTITVKAVNKLGKSIQVTKTIVFAPGNSALTVGELPETTDKKTVTVSWATQDSNDPSPKVYVNDEQQYYTNSAVFYLEPGLNTIKVKAVNKLGKTTEIIKTVTFVPPAPTLTVGRVPETTKSSTVTISWSVTDKNDSSPKVYLDDQQVYYSNSANVTLKPGVNTFKLVAENSYGKTAEATVTITYAPDNS